MTQVYAAEGKTVYEAVKHLNSLLTQPCSKWCKPLGPAVIITDENGAFTAYISMEELV